MQVVFTSLFCVSVLFGLTAGCLSNDTPGTSERASKVQEADATADEKVVAATSESLAAAAKVSAPWQEKMFDAMKQSNATEAWGLFSSSGWVDRGQIFVLGDNGKGKRITKVQPAGAEADAAVPMNDKQATAFAAQVAVGANLQDYAPAVMDGVKYEYVHAVRLPSGEIKILQRVYMVNVGVDAKKAPQHDKLVKAFQAL